MSNDGSRRLEPTICRPGIDGNFSADERTQSFVDCISVWARVLLAKMGLEANSKDKASRRLMKSVCFASDFVAFIILVIPMASRFDQLIGQTE